MSPGKKVAYFFWDLVKVVCIALAIIIPVRYFLIQPFYVKGASMEPSFYDDEYLIIDELSYRISQPERGDIIVFRYPKDPSQFFIKRVIALPGEKVEVRDGFVFVYTDEGEKKYLLDEMDYLDNSTRTLGDKVWNLEADEYYVLGDNREHSLDSRVFGPVGRGNIVGKVWLRGWPLTRVKIFSPISYEQFSENK
ncbi:signal peptidase I [Candidatus Falkowbacteria bacterium RIFOXYA2_FULL_35_8]|uniref:Signal peptidase I n=1 Tax=Candidatus Falkowbacteria bacterium RIFOXYC2_FULL_36_12 TaxID=1798002 RepID=A0A1F5SYX0_9BACT|nr:MAG: signal peptidase I [Candidatus Falkowbacteria bacterium RIFOXYB2_FULL_35_7]OGF31925.1 MAG: signal peptidase I [Candidatus Falkowbacteria bacterium RIFOXYC2_FULL_36_12]OGF34008.1 MAG: signal peptidase I [Candidatus Falkowbacteria bacterium RIFOXYA2_FULL_35_8]